MPEDQEPTPVTRIESPHVLVREILRDKRMAWFGIAVSTAMIFAWPFATIGLGLDRFLASGACLAPVAGLVAAVMSLAALHGDAVAGSARKSGAPGKLEIGADGRIVVEVSGDRRIFGKQELDGGWVESSGEHHSVVLRTRSGAVVIVDVPSAAAANELLHAAGVAPEQRAVAIPLGGAEPRASRRMLAVLAMVVSAFTLPFLLYPLGAAVAALARGSLAGLSDALVSAVAAALGAFALFMVVKPLITSTVVIGIDGVTVVTLGRRRFFSFATTRSVRAVDRTLSLEQNHGTPIRLSTSGPEEAMAVATRIREAMAAGERTRVSGNLERLDRRGRSLGAWREELLSMARENRGYRETAFGNRELLQVVEDARAGAERRIAAAAALSAAEDPDVRQRIRVAIDACADERLRIAIDKASAGDVEDEAIEEALRVTASR